MITWFLFGRRDPQHSWLGGWASPRWGRRPGWPCRRRSPPGWTTTTSSRWSALTLIWEGKSYICCKSWKCNHKMKWHLLTWGQYRSLAASASPPRTTLCWPRRTRSQAPFTSIFRDLENIVLQFKFSFKSAVLFTSCSLHGCGLSHS